MIFNRPRDGRPIFMDEMELPPLSKRRSRLVIAVVSGPERATGLLSITEPAKVTTEEERGPGAPTKASRH